MPLPVLPTSLVGSYAQPDWLIDRAKLAGRFPPAGAGEGAVAGRAGAARPGPGRRHPGSRSAPRSAPGSTSSPTARSGARATPTTSPPRSRASTSTTRAPRSTAPGTRTRCRASSARSTGPGRCRSRDLEFLRGAHRPSGQDDRARPVHDEPAGPERPLPRPRVGGDGLRRGRQRRGQATCSPPAPTSCRSTSPTCRPVRTPRARTGSPRSTRRSTASRAPRPCTSASATRRSSTSARRATRSCPSSPAARSSRSRSRPRSRGSTSGCWPTCPTRPIILGVVDLSTRRSSRVDAVADRVRRAFPYLPSEQLVIAPDCGMKYLPRDVRGGQDARDGRRRGPAARRDRGGGGLMQLGHRGQRHRPGACSAGPPPTTRGSRRS